MFHNDGVISLVAELVGLSNPIDVLGAAWGP